MIFYWHEIIAIFCILNTSCVAGANICTHGNFYRQLKDTFTLSNGDSKDFYTWHCLTVTFITSTCHWLSFSSSSFIATTSFLYHTSFPLHCFTSTSVLFTCYLNGITRNYVIIVAQNFYTGTILDFQVQLSVAIWGAIMHQYNISNMPIYIKLQHMTEPHY